MSKTSDQTSNLTEIMKNRKLSADVIRRMRLERRRLKSENRVNEFSSNYKQINDLHQATRTRSRLARTQHLAYGFLKGTKYVEMEQYTRTQPDWPLIMTFVQRHTKHNHYDHQEIMNSLQVAQESSESDFKERSDRDRLRHRLKSGDITSQPA